MAGRLTGDNIILIKQTLKEYNKVIIIAVIIIFVVYSYVKLFYKNKYKDSKQ